MKTEDFKDDQMVRVKEAVNEGEPMKRHDITVA